VLIKEPEKGLTDVVAIWHYLTLILLTWRIGWAHNNAKK